MDKITQIRKLYKAWQCAVYDWSNHKNNRNNSNVRSAFAALEREIKWLTEDQVIEMHSTLSPDDMVLKHVTKRRYGRRKPQ